MRRPNLSQQRIDVVEGGCCVIREAAVAPHDLLQQPSRMPAPHPFQATGCFETGGGERLQGLEHHEPTVGRALDQGALGEGYEGGDVAYLGDAKRSVSRKRSGEHAERFEGSLQRRVEQVIRPSDGRGERTLARSRSRAGREQLEPLIETGGDFGQRHRLKARRGQLDRKRQPVEPPADVDDGRNVVIPEREAGRNRSRALSEQADCRVGV